MLKQHVEMDDGEKCFNIDSYLLALESRIEELFESAEGWAGELGRFELDACQIARYLWACIAIKTGHTAWPMKFKGMPTLG